MATTEEKLAIAEILRDIHAPTIVELGAHCGEDYHWITAMSARGPEHCHYVMVEPDPRNVQHIIDIIPLGRTRRLFVGAIAAENGMRTFHMCEFSDGQRHTSGSLLKPTGHLVHIPECTFPWITTVPCLTLDALFEREWLTKIDLLWVDIQGAEREMIRGGADALWHTRYLFMEVESLEMYEGQTPKDPLIETLGGNWGLVQDFGYNVLLLNQDFTEREPR
jgi:FkbM family methyltransferase